MATYTTQHVAALLGVDYSHVRRLARDLGIGQKIGRDWWFSETDLRAFKRRPDARVEPPEYLPPPPPTRKKKRQ